jgi:hypothetical protein
MRLPTPWPRTASTSQEELSTVRSFGKSSPSSSCRPRSSPRRRTAKSSRHAAGDQVPYPRQYPWWTTAGAARSRVRALVRGGGRVELDVVGQPRHQLVEICLDEWRQYEVAAPQAEIQKRPVGMR